MSSSRIEVVACTSSELTRRGDFRVVERYADLEDADAGISILLAAASSHDGRVDALRQAATLAWRSPVLGVVEVGAASAIRRTGCPEPAVAGLLAVAAEYVHDWGLPGSPVVAADLTGVLPAIDRQMSTVTTVPYPALVAAVRVATANGVRAATWIEEMLIARWAGVG